MVPRRGVLKINGVQHYLWRAVDQEGAVIDILVQPKRDRFAAVRFFRKLLRSSRRDHCQVFFPFAVNYYSLLFESVVVLAAVENVGNA
jgi:DDE domain